MTPTALVTRPEPQASRWAQQLRDAGLPALALPLMDTQGVSSPEAVHAFWLELASTEAPPCRALMFVSPAAVHWFFRQRPAHLADCPWPADTWLVAPGLGSAQALRETLATACPASASPPVVLHPPHDAEQFDSEHLWPVLAPLAWQGQRVVIVSGGDGQQASGRQWLSERWQDAGAQVETLLTYQRGPAIWTSRQTQTAKAAWLAPQSHIWLLSSSDALQWLHTHHLPRLLGARPDEAVPATAAHRLLATHPRIGEAAHRWGWRQVALCAPTLPDVTAALNRDGQATP